ncbi:MAG: mercuric transport protein MerTP [Mesoflavibacter sp.]|nr:mercuric transport protein MerTP [Mesoflavibacter sp.]
MKSENKLIGTGLLAAITASLCCITPVLALIAGTSGIASTFSWIEPFRPYLIGLTILVLGFAWYQKIKPQKEIDCECETEDLPVGKVKKSKFVQSKTFLGIVTVFAIIMLAFPYYSSIFYPDNKKEVVIVDQSDIQTVNFNIEGMTCAGCEESIKHAINKLNGITNSQVSYAEGKATIEFDKTKTNKMEIEKAINTTGYKVIDKKDN